MCQQMLIVVLWYRRAMDAQMITTLIIVFAVIILSMTLHEATHAFVSYWLGDDTAQKMGRLTLNPLAHIDPVTTLAMPMIMALMKFSQCNLKLLRGLATY